MKARFFTLGKVLTNMEGGMAGKKPWGIILELKILVWNHMFFLWFKNHMIDLQKQI